MHKRVGIGKIIFYILSFGICIFAVVYFSEIKETTSLYKEITPIWLVVAMLAQFGTYFVTALIYKRLLKFPAFNVRVKTSVLIRSSIVSLSINQTIPSAGLSGNVFILQVLKKVGLTIESSVTLILLELISFYTAIIMLIGVLIVIAIGYIKTPTSVLIILGTGILIYTVFLSVVIFAGRKGFISMIVRRLLASRLFTKQLEKASLEQLDFSSLTETPWSMFSKHKLRSFWLILLQWCVIGCDVFTVWALFFGLGLPTSPLIVALGFLMTRIVTLLPISPGALIVYEGGMTFFYTMLSIPAHLALVTTILYRGLSFWLPIPIGLLLYKKSELSALRMERNRK